MTKSSLFLRVSIPALVAGSGVLFATSLPTVAQVSPECVSPPQGALPENCVQPNAGVVSTVQAGPNTEPETGPVSNSAGFVISLDGQPINSDPQVEDQIRRVDIALSEADVQIQVNTLDPTPRLDVEIVGPARVYQSGETVTLSSESNYPAFIARGEMRIIDRAAPGGAKLLATVPVNVNGSVAVALPEGRDLVVIHRVYDQRGRYDETEALPLGRPDDRGQVDGVDEGTQFIARRNIRVEGGSVIVSASDLAPGASLSAMGETIRPDANGNAVLERILPAGSHDVQASVTGGGQNLSLGRPVNIAGAEWFYVVVADLTFGRYSDGETGETYTDGEGRLQFYVDGETLSGYRITTSLETDGEDIDDIFRRYDDNSPRGLLARIDPSDGYPTYGDDSTIVDDTPSSGPFYLRVERDNSFLLWGDYQARLSGNGYLRNERALYGAQLHYETPATTARGDARATIDLYAAQPDQVVGRDVFQGTGGSVYFLRAQDIAPGTETVSVELRDATTGRVIERFYLIKGRDYDINHVQGVVTLTRPLTGSINRRLISTNVGGDESINLVVQYEHTPTGGGLDGYTFGGRIEAWVTDDLRLGVTAMADETGIDDQRSIGLDLRYEFGSDSFIQFDLAETEGPGFSSSTSVDGGLGFGTQTSGSGSGQAWRLEGEVSLTDLGYNRGGSIAAYAEQREEGFATIDHVVSAVTGDETLYGFSVDLPAAGGALGFNLYADVYENDLGHDRTEVGAEVSGNLSERLTFDLAVEHLDETTATTDGTRLDAALRLGYEIGPDFAVYAFGQITVDSEGLEDNDRFGLGVNATFAQNWTVDGEVSDGDGGLGGRLIFSQSGPDNASTYFGYELDPGRAIDAGLGADEDRGRYVAGGRRQITDEVAYVAENTYDIFGNTRELTSAYGVTYSPGSYVVYTATLDFGQLTDDVNGDIERRALTFGVRYEDEQVRARLRVELREDDYENPAESDTDALFVVADGQWKTSESTRLAFSIDAARTDASGGSFQEGRYVDANIGFAYRPVDNERMNLLGRYRYFYDNLGQEVDGIPASGPIQESHVLSFEGNYDVNQYWTVGGKIGGRSTTSAATSGGVMSSNDAWLAVANVRYHVVGRWDFLLEARHLELADAGSSESGMLGAVYYHINENAQLGVGYNFGEFSTDLTDLTFDDQGVFLNLVAKF